MTRDQAHAHRAAGDVALTEQFDNHDGGRPEATDRLAGETLHLIGDGGQTVIAFDTARELRVERDELSMVSGTVAELTYEAFPLREGFVSVVVRTDDRHSTFLTLDAVSQRAISVTSALVGDGGKAVQEVSTFVQAGIEGPLTASFKVTEALVGKRIQWRYSSTHAFEHIYLNPTAYCWHGLAGPERWIGDVDPYIAYELDHELYLFSWSETVVPFNGAVILDLQLWQSVGRFFGWDTDRDQAGQIVVGAEGTLLNVTRHEL